MAKDKDLTFEKSYSVDDFKLTYDTKVNVFRSTNDKLYFRVSNPECPVSSGKVAKEIDNAGSMSISKCIDPESGETFWMLHNTSNAKLEFSL